MALKIDAKFEGKLSCAFKIDMRNFRKQNETKSKQKFKKNRSTRRSVKTLFYLRNK